MHHPIVTVAVIGVLMGAALALLGFPPLFIAGAFVILAGGVFLAYAPHLQHHIAIEAGVVVVAIGVGLAVMGGMGTPAGLALVATAVAIGIIYTWMGVKAMRESPPKVNDVALMVGAEGYMLQDLLAGGISVAQVKSEIWTVTSGIDIAKERKVRVTGVSGQKLVVEPAPQGEA